jgi:hypothetical protein
MTMLMLCASAWDTIQSVCVNIAYITVHASHAAAQHSAIGPATPGLGLAPGALENKLHDAPAPLKARMIQGMTCPAGNRQGGPELNPDITCAIRCAVNVDQTFALRPPRIARTGRSLSLETAVNVPTIMTASVWRQYHNRERPWLYCSSRSPAKDFLSGPMNRCSSQVATRGCERFMLSLRAIPVTHARV